MHYIKTLQGEKILTKEKYKGEEERETKLRDCL